MFFEPCYMPLERDCFALSKCLLRLFPHADFYQLLAECLNQEEVTFSNNSSNIPLKIDKNQYEQRNATNALKEQNILFRVAYNTVRKTLTKG